MQLDTVFQLLDQDQVHRVLEQHRSTTLESGSVGDPEKFKHYRNNSVTWHYAQDWIYNLVLDKLRELAAFNIDRVELPYQIAEYNPGEYYNWHADSGPGYRDRTLTLVCTLQTAPGAVFETRHNSYDLAPGEAVIIYSGQEHRATSPQQGTRISLTVWGLEPTNLVELV